MVNKTAVEWLIDTYFGGTKNVTANFKKHIQQALELEKQQMKNAYDAGAFDFYDLFDEYYSETYKKQQ